VTADTTAPPAPTGLTATASGGVDLAWNASSDPSGVPSYQVFRGPRGGTRVKIATVSTRTYHDASVSPATAYDYTVRAVDGAGNVSGDSAVATVTTAAGTTLTFTPVADAEVQQASPTSNFGTTTTLGSDSGSTPAQSYLRFNVAGITGRTVQRAVLRVYVTNGTPDGPGVFSVADTSWSETGITWNTKPALGALLGDTGTMTSSTFTDYTVTGALAGKADGAYTVALGPTPTSDGSAVRSREATSNRPQLLVTVG